MHQSAPAAGIELSRVHTHTNAHLMPASRVMRGMMNAERGGGGGGSAGNEQQRSRKGGGKKRS